ncbi:MAG: FRG domain-containing protein [Eubacteriales bacterium]
MTHTSTAEQNNEIVKINSIQEYLDVIEIFSKKIDFLKGGSLFRGMGNCKYELLPKLYRKNDDEYNTDKYYWEESSILHHFIKKSQSFLANPPNEEDYQKWITIAQHYGAPTRILDWTESCLVALYFAVVDINYENDGVVWALNSSRYKHWFMKNDTICAKTKFSENDREYYELDSKKNIISAFKSNDDYDYPFFYSPYFIDERIRAQQSVFMVWGNNKNALEKIENTTILTYSKESKEEYLN